MREDGDVLSMEDVEKIMNEATKIFKKLDSLVESEVEKFEKSGKTEKKAKK